MAIILLHQDHSLSGLNLGCECCRRALPPMAMLPRSMATRMDLSIKQEDSV